MTAVSVKPLFIAIFALSLILAVLFLWPSLTTSFLSSSGSVSSISPA
uniref:Uncharacterized protein n=1 Tax=Rhizophora mucronata TaxID=61149 RepID=A0A2P2JFG8_RHIMU